MKRKNILLFFIVAALFGFSMYCNITFKAQAEQTNEDLNTPAELSAAFIDSFTDTDNLKNNSINIIKYKTDLFNRNVTSHKGYLSVKEGVSDDKKFHIESSGDDDIVKIVPKELFIHRGEYLYIGKEYAF